MPQKFLPISAQDLKNNSWPQCDIILISGDAYVDHPSYGISVIGRVLEDAGFKVGIIAQPDWKGTKDFTVLGPPRLFFGISSGNVDSLIANYTANKRPRKKDEYSPGGLPGLRPDRAVIVYANRVKEAFPDVPIVLGGIEASLRRLAHYDYWDDQVRTSILIDSRADILAYGMAETAIREISERLSRGEKIEELNNICGTVVVRKNTESFADFVLLPAFEEVKVDKEKFNTAFKQIYLNQDPARAKILIQPHQNRFVVQFPLPYPLKPEELDRIYELPYARQPHPMYAKEGVPGFSSIKFSLISHRGCCGECSFCALYFHQGRIVQSRSMASVLREAETLSQQPDFKGTITDVGGPTANLYQAQCLLWQKGSFCQDKNCLLPGKCPHLGLGYNQGRELYKKLRQLPGVKHVFISSGLRYDLLADDYADEYLEDICRYHISGYLKVAPEHCVDLVLEVMRKSGIKTYEKFVDKFMRINKKLGKKQYLVNYFISSHPGSSLKQALTLAVYLLRKGIHPEQIQDFIPLPLTLAGCIYHTGQDPLTGKKIYVPRTFRERKMQRALIQYQNPKNKKLILQALKELKVLPLAKEFFRRSKA